MFADAAMSLDNVVALAAIAGGNFWLLAIGVLISIPILVYGAVILTRIIRRAPEIFDIGAAFLGWIAGGMAVTDPLVAGWVQANAPALGGLRARARRALRARRRQRREAKRLRRRPSPRRRQGARPASRDCAALADRSHASATAVARGVAAPRCCARAPRTPATALRRSRRRPGLRLTRAGDAGSRRTGRRSGSSIAGFVLLAVLAGLIIFIASFFDSLT